MLIPKSIIGIDFEAYFDGNYSLRKLSTTAYIRSPYFLVHGVGIRTARQAKTTWYRGFTTAYKALHKYDWSKYALLAHNAHFEGLILHHHFGIDPAYYYDTVSMGRALYGMETSAGLDVLSRHLGFGQKVENYLAGVKGQRKPPYKEMQLLAKGCRQDVDLMWKIFNHIQPDYPEIELDLIHHTIKCYAQPVLQVDIPLAKREHEKEVKRRRTAIRKIFMRKGEHLNAYKLEFFIKQLRSRKLFAAKLEELGVEPPMKISPTTEKLTYAFAKNDLEFLALLEHPQKEIRELIEAKLIASSSIHETRPLRIIEHADPAFPVYLNYAGAKNTHRWSGGDKVNAQNLSRTGQLRNCLVAPKGYKLVIGDSGAIEARLNGYMAGQDDLMDQFRTYDETVHKGKPDEREEPYCRFASKLFGKTVTKKNKIERFIGKVCVLALGYQMGAPRFQFTLETGGLGPKIILEHHLYKQYVDMYRSEMNMIVKQWRYCQNRLLDMTYKDCFIPYKCIEFGYHEIMTPSGLPLKYPQLRKNDEGDFVYRDKTKIYGGKIVENCLAAGTSTLTKRGWIPIEQYTPDMQLWDGIEWIYGGELVDSGIQTVIECAGVAMTPDQKVLANDGWKEASQLQRSNKSEIRFINSDKTFAHKWKKMALGIPMHLWSSSYKGGGGSAQRSKARWEAKLRVYNQTTTKLPKNTWNVWASRIRSLARYVRQVPPAITPCLERLRRAWNKSMQEVEQLVRKLLGRYGSHVQTRAHIRSNKQLAWVFPNKLQMGYMASTSEQYTQLRSYKDPMWSNEHLAGSKKIQAKCNNTTLQAEYGLVRKEIISPCTAQVYDIANCGPRHRFTIRNGNGDAFIVHNCIQNLARTCVAEQLLDIANHHRIVLMVHDEGVFCVKANKAKQVAADLLIALSTPPEWAPDLPVTGEVGIFDHYVKM